MNETVKPSEIEKRSFAIITELLGERKFDPEKEPVIKRAIHTTADLEYADTLKFSDRAVERGLNALQEGCVIVTDTQMGKAGINKKALEKLGCRVICFMSDPGVAAEAKRRGVTRAAVSMEKASEIEGPVIFAVGNAPTALIEIDRLYRAGKIDPALVIGVPVGFVNVIESKALILNSPIPFIVNEGRKGGSNVAAALVNALMYELTR